MNIAGSILANYWRRRPVGEEEEIEIRNEALEMRKEVEKVQGTGYQFPTGKTKGN